MSERYSKVFSLPENLYAEGAPVVIAAGALLKDNQTGRVVAQLKLRNISPKTIKAATVCLFPMNTAGQPLGDAVRYEYLDLSSSRDADFGSKSAIPMPDKTTRSFGIRVAEVIFADNSVWSDSNVVWEPLKKPEALGSRLDSEMVKQFQIEYGSGAKNFFLEQKDLWYCVCGAVNRQGETVCHSCRKSIYDLRNIDLDALEEHKKQRVAREQEQAAREAAAARENAKRIKKIAFPIVAVVIVFLLLLNPVIIPNVKYWDAEMLSNRGETARAAIAFGELGSFRDSRQRSFAQWERVAKRKTIDVGGGYAIGLKTDGTVVWAGEKRDGRCDVSGWTDIVAIATGGDHTVGLKADGTVVAVGENDDGQCDVSYWTDIVAIAAGDDYTIGLKADGTVVAVGGDYDIPYGVLDWTDIVAIDADSGRAVGLKTDGTVVLAGHNFHDDYQPYVSGWTDIVDIAAGYHITVGLKADGTVVTARSNDEIQCDVSDWTDIVSVDSDYEHVVGLKADGTVIVAGDDGDFWYEYNNASNLTDIVAIATHGSGTTGLKADGTVVDDGHYYDLSLWKDIKLPERAKSVS